MTLSRVLYPLLLVALLSFTLATPARAGFTMRSDAGETKYQKADLDSAQQATMATAIDRIAQLGETEGLAGRYATGTTYYRIANCLREMLRQRRICAEC